MPRHRRFWLARVLEDLRRRNNELTTPDLIEILLSILKAVVILPARHRTFYELKERRLLGLFQNRCGPNRVVEGRPAGRVT